MLSDAIGGFLPAAAAVALSPVPIVGVVLVLGSATAKSNGPLFALGWVVGLVAVCSIVVGVFGGADDPDSGSSTVMNVLRIAGGLFLLYLAATKWTTRPKPGELGEMPGWLFWGRSVASVRLNAPRAD